MSLYALLDHNSKPMPETVLCDEHNTPAHREASKQLAESYAIYADLGFFNVTYYKWLHCRVCKEGDMT